MAVALRTRAWKTWRRTTSKKMRELQPEGSIILSAGVRWAAWWRLKMAQQLKAQGQTIGLLALLDTYPSGYAQTIP